MGLLPPTLHREGGLGPGAERAARSSFPREASIRTEPLARPRALPQEKTEGRYYYSDRISESYRTNVTCASLVAVTAEWHHFPEGVF